MIEPHDIQAIANALAKRGRGQKIASFNGCAVGVARFSAHPLWERHAIGDELLQIFEGELDITVLTGRGPIEATLRPGAVLVVPQGLWHSPRPRGTVTMLFVNNPNGTEISNETDPRSSN